MDDDKDRPMVVFYGTVAVPLGLVGFIGAGIWYLRNRHLHDASFGAGFVNLGAAILALASIILIVWGLIVILGFKKEADEQEDEF